MKGLLFAWAVWMLWAFSLIVLTVLAYTPGEKPEEEQQREVTVTGGEA